MAWIDTIEDDGGNVLAELIDVHDKYLLEDGSQIYVAATPAWCRSCREFVMVETFTKPEELEKIAQRTYGKRKPLLPLEQLTARAQKAFMCFDREMKSASLWRAALVVRVSPQRCLECGGIEFVILPREGNWIPHPASPSRKVRIAPQQCHASMATAGRLYDTEGRLIPDRDADWG